MTGFEKRSVLALATLYSMRMLGLFMILPVFVLTANNLEGATPVLIGLAMGAYGLSQALLQIPFGMLSDYFGRKKLLILGLILFAVGSVIAALSESIYGVLLGRILQGAGAIASVLMALLSDLTLEENRTKAMAVVGMSIGISFSVALVVGPLVASYAGLSGIFWLTSIFALIGICLVIWVVPTPVKRTQHLDTRPLSSQIAAIVRDRELVRLDIGIFVLHGILTALFLAIPLVFVNEAGIPKEDHWWIYLSVMGTSFFAMVPFIVIAEKFRRMKPVFVGAISVLLVALLSLSYFHGALVQVWWGLFFFFMAFNLLEASLPSLISKRSPAGGKGTAMGVYSTCQFMGAFVGGTVGGLGLAEWGPDAVILGCVLLGLVWLYFAFTMSSPGYSTSMMIKWHFKLDEESAQKVSDRLSNIAGVEDVVVIIQEQAAYLKVDKQHLDEDALQFYREKSNQDWYCAPANS
ncbi:MAG: MFS transporter [Pseudomonadales bacterium]|uniref:DHA1 family MFS permease n=1 Tax=Oleiphilus messinensis TaxID=141451 RepID=A0A1Y0I4V0_9GAMM|nr:MFS transporter [Oleiphilus messinensis]ARU54806.1 DHA1 family MFS permease [Oleiphilus messinensis]MCG8610588.1 MFS transporter [Pseudomonadales bacterium]